MILFVLLFLAGDYFFQQCQVFPSRSLRWWVLLASMLLTLRYRKLMPLFALTLGFVWTNWYASHFIKDSFLSASEGKQIEITGRVAGLPKRSVWQTKFLFKTTDGMLQLSWAKPPKRLAVGDEWRLNVKLKRIHGNSNPGGVDYEAWAFANHLIASGRVVGQQGALLSHRWYYFPSHHIRQKIYDKLLKCTNHLSISPWVIALIIGERQGIPQEYWRVLRNTGTNHLFAIAGLHIGVIFGIFHYLLSHLWRFFPRAMLNIPAQSIGILGGSIAALTYSALSGFSIPTQRACFMVLVMLFIFSFRKHVSAWNILSFALLIVLIINPLTILSESFWLSFGTIGLIIYAMRGRICPSGWWWKWARIQYIIGVGLIPLSLWFFHDSSIISFFANTIAIPWLSIIVLPICLLSTLLLFLTPKLAFYCLIMSDKCLLCLWRILTYLSSFSLASYEYSIDSFLIFLSLFFGVLVLLSPPRMPGKYIGFVFLLPVMALGVHRPENGNYLLSVLDVGQGLSVVVETHSHLLLFDTGPRLGANYDMSESVVLPFLRHQHQSHLDMLVLSHGDNDHAGGLETLRKQIPILTIKSGEPFRLGLSDKNSCIAGLEWMWDNVQFKFLHPDENHFDQGNNSSCVLRIDNGDQRVLITGDLEKLGERQLLDRYTDLSSVDVLIAPHHGSKSSLYLPFIEAIQPRFVVFSTGYRNRFYFPHRETINAYSRVNAITFNTAVTGAVQFEMRRAKSILPLIYRINHHHYWYNDSN